MKHASQRQVVMDLSKFYKVETSKNGWIFCPWGGELALQALQGAALVN
jgi:hypothetical protein